MDKSRDGGVLFGSSRLNALIGSGKVDTTKTLFLDCYNQQVFEFVAPTITTRIHSSNHYLISEKTTWRNNDIDSWNTIR